MKRPLETYSAAVLAEWIRVRGWSWFPEELDAIEAVAKNRTVPFIDLSQDEFTLLIYALGIATGATIKEGRSPDALIRLANAVNRNNPNWTPYEVDDAG